jgi:hypothetical protein
MTQSQFRRTVSKKYGRRFAVRKFIAKSLYATFLCRKHRIEFGRYPKRFLEGLICPKCIKENARGRVYLMYIDELRLAKVGKSTKLAIRTKAHKEFYGTTLEGIERSGLLGAKNLDDLECYMVARFLRHSAAVFGGLEAFNVPKNDAVDFFKEVLAKWKTGKRGDGRQLLQWTRAELRKESR